MPVLFSIIIPTYNRSPFLKIAVDSILDQSYGDFEIIIVDDGSTDDTEKMVQSEYSSNSKIKYIKQQNTERGAARNNGAKIAAGDYVTFFDSDDMMYPNHLEEANLFIENNNNPELFHLNYEIQNSAGKTTGHGRNLNSTANRELIFGNFLSCNGVIIRKDIAFLNPFIEDRTMAAFEDWELWLRMASQYPIHCVNKITTIIINHDERSVITTDKNKLIKRVEALLMNVLNNKHITNYYKNNIHKFKSSCYTYVALHIALTKKNRVTTIKYLIKGIKESPATIFSRRLLAIVKHFI
jgi:glycosyltransferase involved in cell wall biosynthesis